jgi:hypothetical protein
MCRTTTEPVLRIWRFTIEDENGDSHDITPEGPLFIGTSQEAARQAEKLSDAWEGRENALVLRVVYESQGKIKTGGTLGTT